MAGKFPGLAFSQFKDVYLISKISVGLCHHFGTRKGVWLIFRLIFLNYRALVAFVLTGLFARFCVSMRSFDGPSC